jgi:hypothetical protein
MKKTKPPPSRLGSYELKFSEELQIEQIKWPDPSMKSPELEAARDLHKPLEQLLADVHREEPNKRLASMMLRVVKSNDKLSGRVYALTWAAVVLAAIQTIGLLRAVWGWLLSVAGCGR